eukprot:GHVS01056687.1.p1 GENE.GHVS01056687.1~~GHVS01056687.1.p1  ORF type:complete len:529 (-),score=44.34 GHVS01056687.1:687-2273(-)
MILFVTKQYMNNNSMVPPNWIMSKDSFASSNMVTLIGERFKKIDKFIYNILLRSDLLDANPTIRLLLPSKYCPDHLSSSGSVALLRKRYDEIADRSRKYLLRELLHKKPDGTKIATFLLEDVQLRSDVKIMNTFILQAKENDVDLRFVDLWLHIPELLTAGSVQPNNLAARAVNMKKQSDTGMTLVKAYQDRFVAGHVTYEEARSSYVNYRVDPVVEQPNPVMLLMKGQVKIRNFWYSPVIEERKTQLQLYETLEKYCDAKSCHPGSKAFQAFNEHVQTMLKYQASFLCRLASEAGQQTGRQGSRDEYDKMGKDVFAVLQEDSREQLLDEFYASTMFCREQISNVNRYTWHPRLGSELYEFMYAAILRCRDDAEAKTTRVATRMLKMELQHGLRSAPYDGVLGQASGCSSYEEFRDRTVNELHKILGSGNTLVDDVFCGVAMMFEKQYMLLEVELVIRALLLDKRTQHSERGYMWTEGFKKRMVELFMLIDNFQRAKASSLENKDVTASASLATLMEARLIYGLSGEA